MSPELKFQQHIADFLIHEHGYGVLEQSEITDPDYALAEDHLWAFLQKTQTETLDKLAEEYSIDARDEVFRALKNELRHSPLWLLIRNGLKVRGYELKLYAPKPRSSQSVANALYRENRITFRPHYYFGLNHQEIDFVLFLNGLPIVTLELKHEAAKSGWNVHTAVEQYVQRDHAQSIFQLPFLHIAADTSDVKVATDPRLAQNFRWFNTGLSNKPLTAGEYPIEFLYREVLAKDRLLEVLAFFLIHIPQREAKTNQPERPAYTIFPRYHQSRMVRHIAETTLAQFATTGHIGRKLLIAHSAGSGKTLSICWLADRLHSLFKPGSNDKLVDRVIILTDRKALDKNIRDEIENFTHLKDVVGLAKTAEDLTRFLKKCTSIIVTTQQKFSWILEQIEHDPALKNQRIAFLIDEAHRSQEGQMGVAIRVPFRQPNQPDGEDAQDTREDSEEQIARIIRAHDHNQLFVAFTATPAPATLALFGEPFDSYTEAEAITEGYIVDVASSIISYQTLYHLHCPIVPNPDEERLYPAGVIAKALKTVAFQDDGLIQYKAEVMLRLFEERVKLLINGRAKAMIVATSRVAGLRYFQILKEKLRERGADYNVLYAFSDFTHPQTNQAISEYAVNQLNPGELIEDRFEGDDYRLMVVANKFQTGFDQPLLAGMFLDKAVMDRNAVQTVSRLNRCCEGKSNVIVVDFTNNAQAILQAFTKYREGTPFESSEPDPQQCVNLYQEILAAGVFTQNDARAFLDIASNRTDAEIQTEIGILRTHFQQKISDFEQQKAFVCLLARWVKSVHFLTCFFSYPPELREFADFAESIGPQLIKAGTISEMMKLVRATTVFKASVREVGEVYSVGNSIKPKTRTGQKGGGSPPNKVSVQDMIARICAEFVISDEEALFIRQVTEEKSADTNLRAIADTHRNDPIFVTGLFRQQVRSLIQDRYNYLGRYEELTDHKYTDEGAIFDIMAVTVVQHHLDPASM